MREKRVGAHMLRAVVWLIVGAAPARAVLPDKLAINVTKEVLVALILAAATAVVGGAAPARPVLPRQCTIFRCHAEHASIAHVLGAGPEIVLVAALARSIPPHRRAAVVAVGEEVVGALVEGTVVPAIACAVTKAPTAAAAAIPSTATPLLLAWAVRIVLAHVTRTRYHRTAVVGTFVVAAISHSALH